jgi:hypothetical protein
MLTERETEIATAAQQLTQDDFTAEGTPKLAAINAILQAAGHKPYSAEERASTWFDIVGKVNEELALALNPPPPPEAPPPPDVWVRVTEASSNPVALYRNGIRVASLRIGGDAVLLAPDLVAQMRNSDVKFTEIPDHD